MVVQNGSGISEMWAVKVCLASELPWVPPNDVHPYNPQF